MKNASVNWQYGNMLREILQTGEREINKRTGKECAMLPGLTLRVDIEKQGLPLISLRKMPIKPFVAEQMWFLSGSNKIDWLKQHTKIWDAFAEEDGTLTAAYGHRWRQHFEEAGHKVDQLAIVLDKLKNDLSTRHGVVMMWDPVQDLLIKQKNVPCPYTFTLMHSGGRLHLHLTVRSNDMVLGFPTDAAGFGLLLMILAQKLHLRPGIYTHSISNAHIYEDHYDAANEMAKRSTDRFGDEIYFPDVRVEMPEMAYDRAVSLEDSLLKAIILAVARDYRPAAAISGLIVSV